MLFSCFLDLCVSSLRRGHANPLCIVPMLTDDPRRESMLFSCFTLSFCWSTCSFMFVVCIYVCTYIKHMLLYYIHTYTHTYILLLSYKHTLYLLLFVSFIVHAALVYWLFLCVSMFDGGPAGLYMCIMYV